MANPPQFAILNHAAVDSGIPRESATQRIGIKARKRANRLIRLHRIFSVDSCNENLPEKNIHQNYVGRCGAMPPLETFHGRTRAPPRPAAERNLRLRETVGGAVLLFPDCYLQWLSQLQRVGGASEHSILLTATGL